MSTKKKTIRLVLASFLSTSFRTQDVSALVISPPSSASDYRQLASLLASTFDAPQAVTSNKNGANQQPSLQSKMEVLKWNLLEKSLTEESTYKRYASTARRMRGKKYCLLVAKEYIPDGDGDLRLSVVGIAEMGISLCPVPLQEVGSSSFVEDGSYGEKDERNDTNNDNTGLRPRPTVGVLCVDPTYHQKGIGKALVQKCEQVAVDVWDEQFTFVDVEPENQKALSFFQSCGYDVLKDDSGEVQMRNTTVSTRRSAESRPHYLLRKKLPTRIREETVSEEVTKKDVSDS